MTKQVGIASQKISDCANSLFRRLFFWNSLRILPDQPDDLAGNELWVEVEKRSHPGESFVLVGGRPGVPAEQVVQHERHKHHRPPCQLWSESHLFPWHLIVAAIPPVLDGVGRAICIVVVVVDRSRSQLVAVVVPSTTWVFFIAVLIAWNSLEELVDQRQI